MKRLVLVLVLAAAALPGSAPGAGCPPLDCSPTGSTLGPGLFAVRPQGVTGPVIVEDRRTGREKWTLPAGILNGRLLVHQGFSRLTWFDVTNGRRVATANVAGATTGYLAGSSQNGSRAVLWFTSRKLTTLQIVSPQRQRVVHLTGSNWAFDALDGHNLYLLRYLHNGYQVRRYDLAANRLDPAPLKDPRESALIWGSAWTRLSSPDGRYLFTLYVAQNGGAMVHELDVRNATARCIDLPGNGGFNLGTTYAMQLSPDGRTLWAVSAGHGRAVGIDVASARVRVSFAFAHPPERVAAQAPNAAVSAISRAGDRVAVAFDRRIWTISLTRRALVAVQRRVATALAFSTDGTRLWVAGGTGRVRGVAAA